MSGETLASKLAKQMTQYGHPLATAQIGDLMSIIDSHYRVVRQESSTEELEEARRQIQKLEQTREGVESYVDEVEKDRNHLAEVVKALEEVIDGQNIRLRALKESVNIVGSPRGFEALFRPLPPEEQRQKALVKTAEWVLTGDAKPKFKNEAGGPKI